MLLYLTLFTALVSQGSSQMGRVIGGKYASPGFFRYYASLQILKQHFCGGSIISETYVITAAHCTEAFKWTLIKVRVGTVDLTSRSGEYIDVSTVIEHPQHNSENSANDIALVKLAKSLRLGTRNVNKIAISTDSLNLRQTKIACVSGFGQMVADGANLYHLKYAYIPVWSRADCIPILNRGGRTERMICAGDRSGKEGSCPGDSGGPLELDGKLYGIVSGGFYCGAPNLPGLYTYVPDYRSWIQQYVN